ncbi:MAG: hypothetical protein ACRECT_05130 [Thermoplasmata archaeon]
MAPVLRPADPRSDDLDESTDAAGRQALREQLERVAEEKRRALADPGPGWREWWFQNGARWWLGLGLLIVDAWIIVEGLDLGAWIALFPALVGAIYAEFLLWRFLWYVPSYDAPRRRGPFRATWTRPVQYGRWTPEGAAARAGPRSVGSDDGPRPEEFL